MPEGPEIRRSADQLAKVLVGNRLKEVQLGLPGLEPHRGSLVGARVKAVTSWGKAMLIHLENDTSIYSHNQLYGKWLLCQRGQLPDTNRQLRLGLHTDHHSALLYSASDISVWPTCQLDQQPLLAKLGPDILDPQLTTELINGRLESRRFCNRSLGALLLDQGFIAGLGNYLRSEILFFAGCHPDNKPVQLTAHKRRELARQALAVTRRSYDTAGYTVPDAEYQRAIRNNADYEASRFMVFDRDTLPCRRCHTAVEKVVRGCRRLYLCPTCQPFIKEPTP